MDTIIAHDSLWANVSYKIYLRTALKRYAFTLSAKFGGGKRAMKKQRVGIIIVILVLIGVFSVSISMGGFFFTTKYYNTPIDAYNADAAYSPLYGDTKVRKEIGTKVLDGETCLFIGEVDENRFIINEMDVKNGRYASKGTTFFYDLREGSDGTNRNQTNTSNGYVKWAVLYSQEETERLSDVASAELYACSNGQNIYLVLY